MTSALKHPVTGGSTSATLRCYMWWTTRDGQLHGNKFEGHAYAANDNHGQRITIIPELKMVVVQSVDHSAGDAIKEGTSYDGLLARMLAARRAASE